MKGTVHPCSLHLPRSFPKSLCQFLIAASQTTESLAAPNNDHPLAHNSVGQQLGPRSSGRRFCWSLPRSPTWLRLFGILTGGDCLKRAPFTCLAIGAGCRLLSLGSHALAGWTELFSMVVLSQQGKKAKADIERLFEVWFRSPAMSVQTQPFGHGKSQGLIQWEEN